MTNNCNNFAINAALCLSAASDWEIVANRTHEAEVYPCACSGMP